MNSARNELIIKLGGEDILLRPTFENVSSMESNLGGVAYLGWKFSRGAVKDINGVMDTTKAIKSLPSMSEVAQIIYYNQAAVKSDDPTQKKYSLEEIWDRLLKNGAGGTVVRDVTMYLAKLTAGDKINTIDDMTDAEKKSTVVVQNQSDMKQ